ncbi:transporter suffix domain-containing protein [Paenibacillus macquariensis]|nr:transporter suffix domain-containing protein [Paenibacillus macquariensis]MEC0092101.1 transporter suffix domain-containing protein [Paenibacillus macquariensis]
MEKEMVSIEKKQKKSLFYKLGTGLLITSLSLWLIPVITPFTPLPTQIKAGIITGSIIIAEIMFWIGALLVGKEVASKFKSYLNPKNWRRKVKGQKHGE